MVLRALMSAYFPQKKQNGKFSKLFRPASYLGNYIKCLPQRRGVTVKLNQDFWHSRVKKPKNIQRFYFGASEVCVGSKNIEI